MKVLCIDKPGTLEIKELEKPELKPGSAIVRIEMCGICGSDVTAYRGVNPTMKYPVNGLGHEGVGTIVEIGENEKGLKVGDRVALEPYVPCNTCHMCKEKRFNNCADIRVCGVHKDGMMAEYFLHPVQQLYKLPDSLSFTHAALIEPFTIGLHAATRARVKEGEHVVVFGAGVIGLMAAFSCISYGATPIIMDVIPERLEYARELGIPHTFLSKDGGVEEYLREITQGKLPEAMIDCTGAPVILEHMHDYVCHGGRIALVGWPHGPVSINTVRLMQKEIDICPSRNSNGKFPEAISLIQAGKIPVDSLITKVISLEETEETIQDMMKSPSKYLKVIVKI
ncbi:MAG: alcohol dehydrogenase catalytic domain-containing protein [Eubacteriales bacterium]|nr:alcohol dehydrogenase catalytic domain-containing protein [Eubacteriales bacterium]